MLRASEEEQQEVSWTTRKGAEFEALGGERKGQRRRGWGGGRVATKALVAMVRTLGFASFASLDENPEGDCHQCPGLSRSLI